MITSTLYVLQQIPTKRTNPSFFFWYSVNLNTTTEEHATITATEVLILCTRSTISNDPFFLQGMRMIEILSINVDLICD
jgi:hypothetical protein